MPRIIAGKLYQLTESAKVIQRKYGMFKDKLVWENPAFINNRPACVDKLPVDAFFIVLAVKETESIKIITPNGVIGWIDINISFIEPAAK